MSIFRNLIFTAGLVSALSVSAQSKINPAGNLIINDYKTLKAENRRLMSESGDSKPSYPAIVMLNDAEKGRRALLEKGLEIISDMDDIVTVELPVELAEEIAGMPEVRYVDFGQKIEVSMDYARPASGVTLAQEGFSYDGQTLSFDGTGVVAGMMDTGLQASHVNFKTNNGQGDCRIQRLFWFRGNGGTPTTYTPANIATFSTDDQGQSHATHVAGIMGGSYNGNGTYASVSSASGGGATRLTGNIPYYGVATGADLAFAVGQLYTANITGGVERIVAYAKESGQPCVVNLSLGSTSGPHDGSDAYSQILSRLGKDAIICMAAGNDGDVNMSIVKSLTASDPRIQTMIAGNSCEGAVDIWGQDNSVFSVQWAIYNTATRTFTPLVSITGAGQSQSVSSSNNAAFGAGFTGTIQSSSSVNPLNNRYNVYSNVSVSPLATNRTSRLALIVEGTDGQKVWVYGNSSTSFESNSLVGWTAGTPDNSINDAACAENIISVGSYTTRTTWGILPATGVTVYQYTAAAGFTLNGISPFSSYGASFQGVQLPMVCAPGANIISSYNRYYVTSTNQTLAMSANTRSGIANDYWGPMQGTSMACPYVSGVVAMWLQACPTLTYDEVVDVLKNSSTYSALTMRGGRWGYGKIDATAGLKYILQKYASVGQVWDDDSRRLVISPNGNGYDVTVAGEKSFEVELIDLQGRRIASASGTDGSASVAAEGLDAGVYVISVSGPTYRGSEKIMVR